MIGWRSWIWAKQKHSADHIRFDMLWDLYECQGFSCHLFQYEMSTLHAGHCSVHSSVNSLALLLYPLARLDSVLLLNDVNKYIFFGM